MDRVLLINKDSFDIEVFDSKRQLFTLPNMIDLVLVVVDPVLCISEWVNDCVLIGDTFVKLDTKVVDVVELEAD